MKLIRVLLLLLIGTGSLAQFNPDTVKAGMFDNGKMWTFDFPPVEYFEKEYGFKPDQEWFDGVRMSALRFASWCSASFVSANGLVMTNHHCSRDVALKVQKEGENFLKDGYSASTLADERKVEGLYVDQLVMIEDITSRVQKAFNQGKTDQEKVQAREKEFEAIRTEYGQQEQWKGLTLQTMTFFQGGKYSLYGFKRYNDVRLVAIPELALGFFGGDFDNFTYPRYCLDFTFFRVYDEDGKPHNPKYYYKFNPAGAQENEPVFVVGNPGTTNRQATVSILEFFRDYQYPTVIKRLQARSTILQKHNEAAKSDSVLNIIFGYENTIKAVSGQLEGLQDPYIMARRRAFEKEFKIAALKNTSLVTESPKGKQKNPPTIWDEIASTQAQIAKNFKDAVYLQPSIINSDAFGLASAIFTLTSVEGLEKRRSDQLTGYLKNYKAPRTPSVEQKYFEQHLREIKEAFGDNDPYVKAALKGRTPAEAAADILKNTKVYDAHFRNELIELGSKGVTASTDPLIAVVRMAAKRNDEATKNLQQLNPKMASLRAKLALMMFDVYGTRIPPDATFSLRLADGRVKGYEYNGTKAPYQTTFYGLYDRFYSFQKEYPWALPERWQNPSPELLRSPMNFVSTNDIIGGNSGSPMINKNREVVGLIFDGNMESLPGNYIFLPEKNRTVSVHAGGIYASLKYVYKLNRIADELVGK
jgi:hypothetical protein